MSESVHRQTWYVLHVKPRTEKKVATFLSVYGCLHVLLTWTKVTKVQRRKVKRELPLFPGYVFARLDPANRLKMLQTNLLVATLNVPHPRELVHQLRQIRRAGRKTEDLRPAVTFREGELVRIGSGPFWGVEGRVKRQGSQVKLILNVELLNQAVEVAVDPRDVERVEERS